MTIKPHANEWYDRLATTQTGYYYPWRSHLSPHHGEDVYLRMVAEQLTPETDLLEAACGHGKTALALAPHCRSVVAYDRMADWIEMAQESAAGQGIDNVSFLCHDSSIDANDGWPRLPGDENSYNLLICSKGPFHWMVDAPRVARPGATLLMLVPHATPHTEWMALLPRELHWHDADPDWARPAIEARLAEAKLELDSWWSFDVPETFPSSQELYTWLVWGNGTGEAPSFEEMAPILDEIFMEFGDIRGVEVRYWRYIWKAIVP